MKTIIAIIAAAGLLTANAALARHDDEPHGYNEKAVAGQQARVQTPANFSIGPRPHDAVRRTVKPQPQVAQQPVAESAKVATTPVK